MTENDWLSSKDPDTMVQFLRGCGRLGDRPFRLFTCACAGLVWDGWDAMGSPAEACGRRAIAVARALTEGGATEAERQAVRREMAAHLGGLQEVVLRVPGADAMQALFRAAVLAEAAVADDAPAGAGSAVGAVTWPRWGWRFSGWTGAEGHPAAGLAALMRDIFGPLPFREVHVTPRLLSWNDGAVVKLAQTIYGEREMPHGHLDRARLAVLADALDEAGCDNPELLGHLRQQDVPHVRGCWAVDLLLGKM